MKALNRFIGFATSTLVAWGIALAFARNEDAQAPQKNRSTYAELKKVPEKARGRSNPFENEPEAAVAGRKLFLQHCAGCHGNNAEGSRKGPSLRAEEVRQASPGTLFWILTNGVVRRGMPVWSKLPEPQRWQIVTYLQSLEPKSFAPR